jgi:hypothetical protein
VFLSRSQVPLKVILPFLNKRLWPQTWLCLLQKPRRLKYERTCVRKSPFSISQHWLLLQVWHHWLHLDLEKSPQLCSLFELSRVVENHLFLWEVEGCWLLRGLHPLKLFLWTVVSVDSANLVVLSPGSGVASPRKSDFVPYQQEVTHWTEQKSVLMQLFWPN